MKKAIGLLAVVFLSVAGVGMYFASSPPRTGPDAPSRQGARRGAGVASAVVTSTATRGDFPVLLRSIGYAEPMASVAVKSRVQSQLLEQRFTEGQMVKKGDLLFTLDDRELAAQAAKDEATLARDQATLARATTDLQRARQLLAKNAGTQQALDQANADQKTAAANVQADRAALDADLLRLSYARIYAPIEGRAGAVNVTPGNLVNASDSGPGLVVITQLKPLRVTFVLPERELPRVQAAASGAKAPVVRVFPHGGEAHPTEGRLTFIDSSVDQASGTITLKAEFANDDLSLWPGQYCDVEIEIGAHANAVTIPTVALQTGQKGSYVYVVAADSTARIRVVTPGLSEKNRTEISAGLEAGERVVVDGQLRLSDGASVRDTAIASEAGASPRG